MKFKNNTCSVCGLACDDIDIELRDNEIRVYNACAMGESKYKKLASKDRILRPLINGKETTWERVIDRTAEILVNAKKPLLFMGSEMSTEAMKVGIEMAEYLGGVVDGNSTMCHGPTIQGMQITGIPTATLGEVKNRTDLVIYWGCNPMESHPRLLSRYSLFPRGYFNYQGRRGRTIVVVDTRRTMTADLSDLFIQVEPNKDFELMSAICAILNGHKIKGNIAGVESEKIYKLVDMMKNCQFGTIFVGLGLASSVGKHRNIEKALNLTRDLNRFTRFILLINRGHSNVTGFNEIMTWSSGYPFGVDYSRGYPRYNPGETTTIDLLANREVDA
ncbi:MAG TPA: formylmethanofuran dehydrogenase subunit B, partial [Candidatus Altiarchaeales archaeon]|nr:formylmethanofuran dehydrogenase subunit B [Candidatus Altiarchaeales archaeon]